MIIVGETNNYIVIHKPAGIATQTARLGEKDIVSEVKNYLAGKRERPYVAVINRLDQPVEGLVLMAKNEKSAAALSNQLTEGRIEKYYIAQVYGSPMKDQTLTDYLIKDSKTNMSKVVGKDVNGSKKAVLEYTIKDTDDETSIVRIHLITGRHHQIRVQMSNMGCPLIGDRKYGNEQSIKYSDENNIKTVRLKACQLRFNDPANKKQVEYIINEDF